MDHSGIADLVNQIKDASLSIEAADHKNGARLDALEADVNRLFKQTQRPSAYTADDAASTERTSAEEMVRIRHSMNEPKATGQTTEFIPSPSAIDEAVAARRAFSGYVRHANLDRLDNLERKSLSSFSFGGSGFLVPPERAAVVLRCLVDPTDLSGLVDSMVISGPSVVFQIDNSNAGMGMWACEAGCYSNNPNPDLSEGLGQLEIKPETIRMVVCATTSLIEDAAADLEGWIMRRVSEGIRATINNAIVSGDGIGKPLGLMSPQSGIPICEASESTPSGTFTWMDLVQLKYQIPMQWQQGSVFVMNQKTFAHLLTMQDATQRPLWTSLPGAEPGFTLAGSPIVIATKSPTWLPARRPCCLAICSAPT